MDIFFSSLINIFSGFYHSGLFAVIKFFLGIYVAVLLVDIILIVILRGFGYDVRVALKGMDMPAVSRSRMEKRWEKVRARIRSENASQYKAAILEADAIVNKIFSDMRIPGKNLGERLANMKPAQVYNYEAVKEAHRIRNKIIHKKDFMVEKEKAEEIIGGLEKLLRQMELM